MFAVGETLLVPETATVPMLWLILTDVAVGRDQVSVARLARRIVSGEADSVTVGIGGGAGVTVTVALAVTEPVALVAVIV